MTTDRRLFLKAAAASALVAPASVLAQSPQAMTQRVWDSPAVPAVNRDFWTSAYQAIDD